MTDNFNDVGVFHDKFGLANNTWDGPGRREVSSELLLFRHKFMHEELDEFWKAWQDSDEAKMADALIDLVYVAMGTAHLMGLPWHTLWEDVQRANMTKVRASPDQPGVRGHHEFDVVKPEGWEGPHTEEILKRFGW